MNKRLILEYRDTGADIGLRIIAQTSRSDEFNNGIGDPYENNAFDYVDEDMRVVVCSSSQPEIQTEYGKISFFVWGHLFDRDNTIVWTQPGIFNKIKAAVLAYNQEYNNNKLVMADVCVEVDELNGGGL